MTLEQRLFAADVLPCERKRYFALWYAHLGYSSYQIAGMGLLTAPRVRRILHLYQQGGLDALKERVHPGRPSRLTPEVLADIRQQLESGERTWNSRTLCEFIAQKHGITLGRTALRDQLRAAGMSWQRTRYVVAGQADPEQKAAFRNDLEVVKKGRSTT